MGKHVLSHQGKSLAWQLRLRSMTPISLKAKTAETQAISKNNIKIRALNLLRLVMLRMMILGTNKATESPMETFLCADFVLQPWRKEYISATEYKYKSN